MHTQPDNQDPNRREQLRQALEQARDPFLRFLGVVFVGVGAGSLDDQIMERLVELHHNVPTSFSQIVQITRALDIPDEIVSIGFMGSGAGFIAASSERVRQRIAEFRSEEEFQIDVSVSTHLFDCDPETNRYPAQQELIKNLVAEGITEERASEVVQALYQSAKNIVARPEQGFTIFVSEDARAISVVFYPPLEAEED